VHLETLKLLNFKNYTEANLLFSEKINCFTGKNASGKTNLLDAIYMLSFTKSYFNTLDKQIINAHSDEPFYFLSAHYRIDNDQETISLRYHREKGKRLTRNDKEVKRFSKHIGEFPVVMMSPGDIFLVTGGSDLRRRFLDITISQFDADYMHHLTQYNNALKQRNHILKNAWNQPAIIVDELLAVWNEKLIQYGQYIYEQRHETTKTLCRLFNTFYRFIANDNDQVEVTYESQLSQSSFAELLAQSIENDRRTQYTTTGIHKDDLVFKINDMPLKKVASQGQQKTLLITLKLAEYEIIKQHKNRLPLLLLDDVFDKLDAHRVARLIEQVATNEYGQIFITDTHQDRMQKVLDEINVPGKLFSVEQGKIQTVT